MTHVFECKKCNYCGKEFLVERILIGADHTTGLLVTCKSCAKRAIEDEHMYVKRFKRKYPQRYETIKKWAMDTEEQEITEEKQFFCPFCGAPDKDLTYFLYYDKLTRREIADIYCNRCRRMGLIIEISNGEGASKNEC